MDCARCTIIAETYANCCVAFGIVDGTESLLPESLVNLLSTLFSYFDEIFTSYVFFFNTCANVSSLDIIKIKVKSIVVKI